MRKLAIRSLRRCVGSMDYIESLLIMEDDLDEDECLDDFGNSSTEPNEGNRSENPDPTQDPEPMQETSGLTRLVCLW